MVLIVVIAVVYLRYKKREDSKVAGIRRAERGMCQPGEELFRGRTIDDLIEASSGSGSGLPLLVSDIAVYLTYVRPCTGSGMELDYRQFSGTQKLLDLGNLWLRKLAITASLNCLWQRNLSRDRGDVPV